MTPTRSSATVDAVIFDVDGTLVDSNYQHALAWYRALRRYDVTVPVWTIHRAIGMGGDQLIAAVAGDEIEDRYRRDQGWRIDLCGADRGFSCDELKGAGVVKVFDCLADLQADLDNVVVSRELPPAGG